jgi:uncharacterized protein YodC (DUF2158 family)
MYGISNGFPHIGDVVLLKSGGLTMTIAREQDARLSTVGEARWLAKWFVQGAWRRDMFLSELLIRTDDQPAEKKPRRPKL